jgi:FKBP-type peptidyl-prolyl cis-trans isomerase FkpA
MASLHIREAFLIMKKYILFLFIAGLAIKANAQNDFKRTAKGTAYRIITNNPGERIKQSQVITFNVIQKTDKDSVLFSTYVTGNPVKTQVQPEGDLMDIFPLLTVKDSVIVKVPTDSIFKEHEQSRPPFLPKGSSLIFIVKIEQVQSLEEAIAERNTMMEKVKTMEAATAAKYITDNKLAFQTTASGLKYKITQPSVKRKPLAGDTVFVNYIGHTLDGKLFDTSIEAEAQKGGLQQPGRNYEPISVIVGQGQVIRGWDEGLLLLNEGSKATFLIPSDLAYGDKGSGEIKPFSTLLFDVELVKVNRAKHAAVAKPGVKKAPAKPGVKKPLAKKPVAIKKK